MIMRRKDSNPMLASTESKMTRAPMVEVQYIAKEVQSLHKIDLLLQIKMTSKDLIGQVIM